MNDRVMKQLIHKLDSMFGLAFSQKYSLIKLHVDACD